VKTPLAKPTEVKCPACNGTGFLAVIQPAQPGRMAIRTTHSCHRIVECELLVGT
jgi:pyruvate/2-oxoacid:ferredoxin oxidoreductase beta subunit